MITSFHAFYKKHERWVPIVFFIIGFIFDAYMLRRVDELLTIVQQAVYLFLAALLLRAELIETQRPIVPPMWLNKIWVYREAILHFLMGTLLNAYTIFFFKSASAFTSFFFIALLVVLLMANEFGRFGKSQTKVHVALCSLCLISYLITLVPIILGFIGIIPFLVANIGSVLVFNLYCRWLKPSLETQPRIIKTHLSQPFYSILIVINLLYFAGVIPPVPLSVQYMGIYHDIKKVDGDYELSYLPSGNLLSFWHQSEQTFKSRPGDIVHCFARIFSPARFKDQLQVRWLFFDSKIGRKTSDLIPLPIVGGREEGYRGITKKTNYQPGEWRVQIETTEGREVGRVTFKIENDESIDEREFKIAHE